MKQNEVTSQLVSSIRRVSGGRSGCVSVGGGGVNCVYFSSADKSMSSSDLRSDYIIRQERVYLSAPPASSTVYRHSA